MDASLKSKLKNEYVVCPVCSARHFPAKGTDKNGVFAAHCESCGHFIKFRVKTNLDSEITLTVNGTKYTVGNEYPPTTSLNAYLRNERISMGTKYMCHEGGCGSCVVEAKLYEPISDTRTSYPVNSCLLPLFSCDGMEITTVEGISDEIPKTLAKYNGSQCGFCSPGQVMNMHALLGLNQGKVTMKEVEDSFDANICRCTGYRSILDAMKSFAVDCKAKNRSKIADIEDLQKCPKTGELCKGKCHPKTGRQLQIVGSSAVWYRPTTMDEFFKVLGDNKGKKLKYVFGNSGKGVYYSDLDNSNFEVLIDIRGINELYGIDFDSSVVLGSNLSLNQLLDIFTRTGSEPFFGYFTEIRNMLQYVATHAVRSLGCWAGNLMLKHLHPEFQSDVFITLVAVNARLMIASNNQGSDEYSMEDFLKLDMTNKIIVAMVLDSIDAKDYTIRLYKVGQRKQNAHSFVNAGIRMKIDKANNFTITEKPCIAFSGIAKDFVRAEKTESLLQGKSLSDSSVIQAAIQSLMSEIVPDPDLDPLEPDVNYRKTAAIGLFYRFVLEVLGDKVNPRYQSGSTSLVRPLSSGQQSYDTKPLEWPLTEPMVKLEGVNQCHGKAEYIMDIPLVKPLYAAFVNSTVANAQIGSIDGSKALSIPGVVKFITAKDIPGVNNCFPLGDPSFLPEEVLSSGEVKFAGQPLAMIVAESDDIASGATYAVDVKYTNQKPPILTIEDGIKAGSYFPSPGKDLVVGDAATAISKSAKQITGTISFGEQQHMQMETQIAICTPTEDGMDIEASTQWCDLTKQGASMVLGVPESSINVKVKRLGGAYGSKITRNFIVSAGCAVAAQLTNRPVKLDLEFHTNMKMIGRRIAYRADYTVGCDENGKINGIQITMYADMGCSPNDNAWGAIPSFIDNAYYCPNWHVTPKLVKTNKPANTACRAPGSTPSIFVIESIMEHISKALELDPLEVRRTNLYENGQITPSGYKLQYCSIKQLVWDLMTSSQYQQRKADVETFNKANRWKKKGLSVVPMKFSISYLGTRYNAIVNIYGGDGSISIAHGGIESGQGINTKVAQVCAYELGVPIDIVKIKANTTLASANDITTGGSITSELCCLAVKHCCDDLKARMAPVKAKMSHPTWKQLIQQCMIENVDLTARYMQFDPSTEDPAYNSYGVTCTEVELDVLTGQNQITRVDLLYDCGESMNPLIDVGQVEGAFVMGLGYWLTEQVKYNPQNGQVLTGSTWTYKVPFPKDIPIDFRIQLLKNAPNPKGVLRSKAVGEPPLCMSCSALFALKRCVESARADVHGDTFFPLDGPATFDKLQQLCLIDPAQFVIS